VDSVLDYVLRSLREEAAVIVIATDAHLKALEDRWARLRFDAIGPRERGQLVLLDAENTLANFMVDGSPDFDRFSATVGELVARCYQQYGRVAAFGEMVSVLWRQGNPTAAVELESLWNGLAQHYPFTLFCGYALRDCTANHADHAFEQVCAAHTHVIPAETYAPASKDELHTIANLQRKALALELRLDRDEAIQRSLAQMAAIVESSDDAIIGKTLEGIIHSWNTAAERLFGYRAEEVLGKSITLIIPPDLLAEEKRILETLGRGERIDHYETARVAKDGRRVEISLTISPLRDQAGVVIGASTIARDITARRNAEALLRERERALREALSQLQSRTAELARFNNAAVGREGRIIALKREVNELRERLGEAPEYRLDVTDAESRTPGLRYPAEPAQPTYPRSEELVPLDSILRTQELSARPSRPPDYEAENRALGALTLALAEAPSTILQVLADKVLEVLHAGSAGLSLLTPDGQRFYWAAIAGEWSPHLGGGTPREFGPCGDVLDRDAPLLFSHWERRYPYLAAATPLAEEGLLVPFHVAGRAVGTIWAIAHDSERKFDGEDLRLLQSLRWFASAAYQAVESLGAAEERRAALSLLEDAVQARTLAEESLRKLRESEEALREADRRKDEFLALLAHELRNPLAPIRYALAANRKGDRTPEQRKRADEIMERQVAHMSRLLEDLLDVSRITRGTLELKKSPTELTSVLAAAIETARPLLDSKHHTLSLDFPKHAVRLEADTVRLAQVFSNLLINAAKYTDPHGQIRLSAMLQDGQVVVSVRDNGIGISAELMPRLFTMFAQADGVQERTEGGLGVGLALVRGLVTLHGGTVEVHSGGPRLGSVFTVKLPVGEPVSQVPHLDGVDETDPGVGLRILVADDNRDAADTCAALLELSGHHVQTAYTGRHALELAETFRPHAMLLDIGLPDYSGYELAQQIRAKAWGRRTLLIAITGWGQAEDRRRAHEAGFDQHLAKPVAAEAIEAVLRRRTHGSSAPS
jgi:PAS domain S-box-containing protein